MSLPVRLPSLSPAVPDPGLDIRMDYRKCKDEGGIQSAFTAACLAL
jgi:hypothetical protein